MNTMLQWKTKWATERNKQGKKKEKETRIEKKTDNVKAEAKEEGRIN